MMSTAIVNGNIINEFGDVLGTYRHLVGNCYAVSLYDGYEEMTVREFTAKLNALELYIEPLW